jgi:hypothetical protein
MAKATRIPIIITLACLLAGPVRAQEPQGRVCAFTEVQERMLVIAIANVMLADREPDGQIRDAEIDRALKLLLDVLHQPGPQR